MAGAKKKFSCGHSGKGQFCHRCANDEKRRQGKEKQRLVYLQEKEEWEKRLMAAPVELCDLPKKIAEKALEIIRELRQGRNYIEFKGKRMRAMGTREIIAIPLGSRYRLICREREDGQLEFLEAISHETYNKRLGSNVWD